MDIGELLKILSDTNRLRILALLEDGNPCVCDLEAALQLNQSNLSRHLNRLRQAGLVEARKKGLFVYYSRSDIADPAAKLLVESVYQALNLSATFAQDRQRLQVFLKTKPHTACA